MSNIFKSFFVVVAVAAVAGGATYAVFSDTDKFVGNTISTAQVNISALPEAGNTVARLLKPVHATGLIPGQLTSYFRGVIYNESNSTPARLFMYLDNVQSTAGSVCDKTNLTVWTGHAAGGADSERSIVLHTGPVTSFAGVANKIEITGSGRIFNPTIPVNTSAVLQQQAQLDASADSAQQNATCTWDEVFVAETPTV